MTMPPAPTAPSSTPPAAVAPAEVSAIGEEYSFFYEGPIEKRQTKGCIYCISALGMEPPHNCMPGCAICAAGKSKQCTLHQGMHIALDQASVPKAVKGLFDAARSTIEKALEGAPGTSNVRLKVFGQNGLKDAPPRTMTVEVTLLDR
jgi:hypothetical protein